MAEYTTTESVAKLGETDPKFAELHQKLQISARQLNLPLPPPDPISNLPNTAQEYTLDIPMRDGFQSKTRIYRPPATQSLSATRVPLIVLIFGGGFIKGSCTSLAPLGRSLAQLYDAIVVSISYRLAPVHRFPTAPQDTYDNLSWLRTNAEKLGADLSAGFVIGGVSSGGNLAAVIAQQCLDEGCAPALTGVWLYIPYILELETVPVKYKHLHISRDLDEPTMDLTNAGLDYIKAAYQLDVTSPLASPFNSKTPHVGMPPVYIEVNGQDPLRDDGLVYEKVLRDHGVSTKLQVNPGVPHGHGKMAEMGLVSAVRSQTEGVRGFGWLLGKGEVDGDVITKVIAENTEKKTE